MADPMARRQAPEIGALKAVAGRGPFRSACAAAAPNAIMVRALSEHDATPACKSQGHPDGPTRWAQLFGRALGLGVWVLGAEGETLFRDARARSLCQRPLTARAQRALELLYGTGSGDAARALARAFLQGPAQAQGAAGVDLTCVPLHDGTHPPCLVAFLREVSPAELAAKRELYALREELERRTVERTQLQQVVTELEELATRDPLTGLFNRRALSERLDEETSRANRYGAPLSLLMLDIDHFKQVNDRFGHAVGDVVIGMVGRVLEQERRASDVVARYGGEEFAVVLPHTHLEGARVVAGRLRAAIAAKTYRTQGKARCVTVSIGVAALGPSADDAEKLIRAADDALYAAKRAGRNRVR